MKNANINGTDVEGQKVLWSAKPVCVKESFKKWFSSIGVFEKIIVTATMLYPIYFLVRNGLSSETLLVFVAIYLLVAIVLISLRYVEKRRFENTKYILTESKIELISWSLFAGSKLTKIDLKDISKTYLLGITDKVGTVLLYCNTNHTKPRDLMRLSKLDTVGIQYINESEKVKELIDNYRAKTI